MVSLAAFSSVGFAGARAGAGSAPAAALAAAVAAAGGLVFATCGSGAPAAALAAAGPAGRAFLASSAPWSRLPARQRLAARATAFVRSLAAAPSPLLLAWPAGPAPAGLRPGRSWQACGSGTWSEVALASGLGVPVVVFGFAPPSAWGTAVPLVSGPLSGGWLVRPLRQVSLF